MSPSIERACETCRHFMPGTDRSFQEVMQCENPEAPIYRMHATAQNCEHHEEANVCKA